MRHTQYTWSNFCVVFWNTTPGKWWSLKWLVFITAIFLPGGHKRGLWQVHWLYGYRLGWGQRWWRLGLAYTQGLEEHTPYLSILVHHCINRLLKVHQKVHKFATKSWVKIGQNRPKCTFPKLKSTEALKKYTKIGAGGAAADYYELWCEIAVGIVVVVMVVVVLELLFTFLSFALHFLFQSGTYYFVCGIADHCEKGPQKVTKSNFEDLSITAGHSDAGHSAKGSRKKSGYFTVRLTVSVYLPSLTVSFL